MVTKKKPTFEEKMNELTTIVNKLEGGDVPLEEALAEFEKGIKLSRTLEKTLTQAEQSMAKIVTADGSEQPLSPKESADEDKASDVDSDQ
ncbi:MAG: exodeoxyribonuclease VII small subunit [Schleiferilactobacillus harbinensis]|jgi:exodeoxyribonuclease VII small subunit|nr:exodeoxyribonuclease VII small subunit [Schleiferilactobacillus harbinensis]MCI1911785.1 exodeoxyribonuclease VII small subunit [Schleiferilactobacillus harbinensis]